MIMPMPKVKMAKAIFCKSIARYDPDSRLKRTERNYFSMQNDERYSDLTIRCQNDVYRVHKVIVLPRSRVLAKIHEHGQVSWSFPIIPTYI